MVFLKVNIDRINIGALLSGKRNDNNLLCLMSRDGQMKDFVGVFFFPVALEFLTVHRRNKWSNLNPERTHVKCTDRPNLGIDNTNGLHGRFSSHITLHVNTKEHSQHLPFFLDPEKGTQPRCH